MVIPNSFHFRAESISWSFSIPDYRCAALEVVGLCLTR